MQESSKILLLFLILLFCACGNHYKTATNQQVSDSTTTNSMTQEFYLKNNLPKNQWKISYDSLILKKIQEDGFILNRDQSATLLKDIITYSIDDYTATFYTVNTLKDNIITAVFLIQCSDLEEILLVNYSLDRQLIDYLKIWQVENCDLLFQDSICEISYCSQNKFSIEKEHIQLITKYEEFTHNLSTDEYHISYTDSICKYFSILDSGKFNLIRTDSLVNGLKWSYVK